MARTRTKPPSRTTKKPRITQIVEPWQRIGNNPPNWDFQRSCMSRLRGEIFRCYQPKFQFAKQRKQTTKGSCNNNSLLSHGEESLFPSEKHLLLLFPVLNHDAILSFLAPHEILSLWRCSKETWNNSKKATAAHKRSALLQSVFGYLRISEEAALFVHDHIQGGWKSFLPVLVSLCEHMREAYGDLEPDPAHRAFVAEQCCFYYHCKKQGKLLTYEYIMRNNNETTEEDDDLISYHDEYREDRGYYYESDDEDFISQGFNEDYYLENGEYKYEKDPITNKRPAPTLAKLKRELGCHDIWWGHSMEVEIPKGWREENHRYMLEHMDNDDDDDKPNINDHCKERIRRELDPIIWIMFDNTSETMHYALGIGPNLEQYVTDFCHHLGLDKPNSFYLFRRYDSPWVEALHPNGGMVDFLIKFQERDDDDGGDGSIAVAIWCYRHNLEPLTAFTTDYFIPFIQANSNLDDEAKDFYTKALTSELHGPANFEKYKDSVY